MDVKKPVITAIILINLVGCNSLPLKSAIQPEHFRFENFKREQSLIQERIYLMCDNHRPTGWTQPRQYKSGQHALWVKASVSERHVPNTREQAFYKFTLTLEPQRSYMLNRAQTGNELSVWIQDAVTGERVSDVQTDTLEPDVIDDYFLQKKRCEAGTV